MCSVLLPQCAYCVAARVPKWMKGARQVGEERSPARRGGRATAAWHARRGQQYVEGAQRRSGNAGLGSLWEEAMLDSGLGRATGG